MPDPYHNPVMLKESMEGLLINPDGVYVDLTFGGGGHAAEILRSLGNGKLFAFDQDPDARANAAAFKDDPRFTFIDANFRYFVRYLKMHNITTVDGILADLGVSSHQIDSAERGFSTRFDAILDMRMSREGKLTARVVLDEYSGEELQKVFSSYGEIRNARTLASAIVNQRKVEPIHTVNRMKKIAGALAPKGREIKYISRIFQALRIEVNEEMAALDEMLSLSLNILKSKGRLVVISYHSLEDRKVKYMIKYGNIAGKPEKDFYGNLLRPMLPIVTKPITPAADELAVNSRARSAKLRIGEKL